jgi:hypothetical protein
MARGRLWSTAFGRQGCISVVPDTGARRAAVPMQYVAMQYDAGLGFHEESDAKLNGKGNVLGVAPDVGLPLTIPGTRKLWVFTNASSNYHGLPFSAYLT